MEKSLQGRKRWMDTFEVVRYKSGTEENEWRERELLELLAEHFTSGKQETGDKTRGT